MTHDASDDPFYDDGEEYLIDGVGFASEGSALRAATKDNPRDQPCPTCHWPNVLTHIDVQRGYQCDACARTVETGADIYYYEDYLEAAEMEREEKSGDLEYKFSVVMLIQVDVEATSSEVAIEMATTSSSNWLDWNLVDTPAGPEVVNTDP